MNTVPPPLPGRPTAKGLLRQTWFFFFDHEIMTRASAIAFTTLTASVPLLAVVLIVLVQLLPDIGSSFDTSHTGLGVLMLQQLQVALQGLFPPEAYKVVEEQIARMQSSPPFGVLSVGLAVTLWCASGVFRAAIDAMNRIYGIVEQRPVWRVWLLSIWMVLIQTALMIGALLLFIAWPYFAGKMGLDAGGMLLSTTMRWTIIFSLVIVSFGLMFHMGPDVPQRHRWVTPGSVIGTLLFFATCFGLKTYVQNFAHYDRTYGSLGGVMIIFLWYYVNALVFLVACEVNRLCDFAAKQCKEHRNSQG
jgi:membrane protein